MQPPCYFTMSLNSIQLFGLVCFLLFCVLLLGICITECVGRFNYTFIRRNRKKFNRKNKFKTILSCRQVAVSSGASCACANTDCYCCWKQKQECVIGLPNSDIITDKGNIHNVCAVCLDEYVYQTKVLRLDCGHEFHINCIMTWLKHSNKCPLCNCILQIDMITGTESMECDHEEIFLVEEYLWLCFGMIFWKRRWISDRYNKKMWPGLQKFDQYTSLRSQILCSLFTNKNKISSKFQFFIRVWPWSKVKIFFNSFILIHFV